MFELILEMGQNPFRAQFEGLNTAFSSKISYRRPTHLSALYLPQHPLYHNKRSEKSIGNLRKRERAHL